MNWTSEQRAEAQAVVARLQAYQEAAKLSDNRLLRQFPDLGSTKTWRQRLLSGDWSGLRPERTLGRLRRIGVILDGGVPDGEFYRELPFVREMTARMMLLERSQTDRRILVGLAPNGCGKTTFARWAVAQNPAERCYCRLRPAWRNKELHLANGICRALGSDKPASNAADAEGRLIGLLSGQPRTLFLDQAHEGGAAQLHLMRALVDDTPSRFVYLGYNTTFKRVLAADTDSLLEAQAFLGRCLKPVFSGYDLGVQVGDVAMYLRMAAGMAEAVARGMAAKLTPVLHAHGNRRLLSDAVEAAAAESDSDEPDAGVIARQVAGMAGLDAKKAAGLIEEE